jgi:hypothetical protein
MIFPIMPTGPIALKSIFPSGGIPLMVDRQALHNENTRGHLLSSRASCSSPQFITTIATVMIYAS